MKPIARHFVDADGIRTHYLEAGDGPDLVLMHGGGIAVDANLTWSTNIGPLAEHYHVIAFDQLGFGKTDMPSEPANFTKLHRARHAVNVLDALRIDSATLVGHSEGGFVATKIAIDCAARVEKLVLVASGATAPLLGGDRDRAGMQAAREAYNWELEASCERAFIANFKRSMFYYPQRVDDHLLSANYREAQRTGNVELYLNLPPDVADETLYYAAARQHIHPYLSALEVETLLVWARDDATVPIERGVALMDMLPNAEMHILNHAKHMVMIDASERFNRLLLA